MSELPADEAFASERAALHARSPNVIHAVRSEAPRSRCQGLDLHAVWLDGIENGIWSERRRTLTYIDARDSALGRVDQ